ncbi:uncharacterized protein LOC135486924 [Lineus longissimus]|uniref:uncharacterized protein LOC135486924 n=1 Tax=Lineus longissimus TaxID=88925 RepID=UPI002B4F2978
MKRKTEAANGRSAVKSNGNAPDVLETTMKGYNSGFQLFHMTIVPVFLIAFTPNMVILLWYTAVHTDGSFMELGRYFQREGVIPGMVKIWSGIQIVSMFSLSVVIGYSTFALLLMKFVPGRTFKGPVTPKGNTPVYKDNGFACYIISMTAFSLLTVALKQYGYSTSIVYDKFDEILATLCVFSLVFCLMLYIKGINWPTTTDSGSSGNFIFDYYWGTELYPRIFGFDVKTFTNCRFGMTVWPLLVAVHAIKSYELYGFVDSMFVSALLQFLYMTKFFWWEAGYMWTIDIMLDRAGYYICWGCLVYVPGLYASPSLYLVNHPVQLGLPLTVFLLVGGALSIYVNYWADEQKQHVRKSNGDCLVWGAKPDIIRASYVLENGEKRESILLASGFWGVARHFHYLPEWMLSFAWSVPALFNNIMPYIYFLWLVILLTHRSFRDDEKCGKKYGKFWTEYRQRVPYRVIPGIF